MTQKRGIGVQIDSTDSLASSCSNGFWFKIEALTSQKAARLYGLACKSLFRRLAAQKRGVNMWTSLLKDISVNFSSIYTSFNITD